MYVHVHHIIHAEKNAQQARQQPTEPRFGNFKTGLGLEIYDLIVPDRMITKTYYVLVIILNFCFTVK